MKLMIASDLHGSAYYAGKLLDAFRSEAPEKLLLLGDLLYHGPRNALPRDYDCMAAAALLNGHFHLPAARSHDGWHYINPGSTSIPKDGSTGSYLILENRVFTWKDMDGTPYQTYTPA